MPTVTELRKASNIQTFRMKFNTTIIPFTLVGYETGYSPLGCLLRHIQRTLTEQLLTIKMVLIHNFHTNSSIHLPSSFPITRVIIQYDRSFINEMTNRPSQNHLLSLFLPFTVLFI